MGLGDHVQEGAGVIEATIICGDAREMLKTLPDESVQCVVTSPPYFGLRDYKLEPQVWGGEPSCQHQWTDRTQKTGATCSCGAWLGSLGLEPTPALYVQRLVEVFRAVRRVLRKDGTLWLNLGDCFAGSGKGLGSDHGKAVVEDEDFGPMIDPPPGIKAKDLLGMPWRVTFALQADGWWLRSDIIWSKPNPMPESVMDRPTRSHEYLFLLTKNGGKPLWWRAWDMGEWSQLPDRTEILIDESGEAYPRWRGFDYYFYYYYDAEAIKEEGSLATVARLDQSTFDEQTGGPKDPKDGNRSRRKALEHLHDKQRGHSRRHDGFNDRWDLLSKEEQCALRVNKRTVWEIATQPYPEAHFATFPKKLVKPCILAGSKPGDVVLDPFCGSGTTLAVAMNLGRHTIGIELNPDYCKLAERRCAQGVLL